MSELNGGIFALLNAVTVQEQVIGFFAVLFGAGNAASGYAVTERMLAHKIILARSDALTKVNQA